MKKRNYSVLLLVMILVFSLLATGCQSREEKENAAVETVAGALTAEEISQLEKYPNLKEADLRGSDSYQDIVAYIQAHPEVTVNYDVNLGQDRFDSGIAALNLADGAYDYSLLLENLKYLPKVTSVELPDTTLSLDEINALKETYPSVSFDYSVSFRGTRYESDASEIDASGLKADEMEDLLQVLSLLPQVSSVELMDGENTSLTVTDVKTLQTGAPGVFFHYNFELFGKTVSTSDETIIFVEQDIGNEGEAEIRAALDILTNCTYFKLEDCGLSSEVMAGIRDDYPDVKVVWRVYVAYFSMCTDETMMRMTHGLENEHIDELKYCTDVTYMDIGHNSKLTDISFVQYMTKLECVIVSGAPVEDVSYFKHCPNLTWLELAFCGNVKDLSWLAGHENIKYVNVSFSQVSDISALMDLGLERFNCMETGVSRDDRKAFEEKNPDCIALWEGVQPYGYGWRYDDYGYTFFDYYRNMRVVFRYDDTNYWGNHKE